MTTQPGAGTGGTAASVRAELEETARTYLTNAHHHGDDCPFCNGEVKALMQLADAYAQAAAGEQPAPAAAPGIPRHHVEQLLADVTASADTTRPSAKTRAEDELAAQLRQLLEDQ